MAVFVAGLIAALLAAVSWICLPRGALAAAAFPQSTYKVAPITSTLYLPLIRRPASRLLIAAAHIDSAVSGEGDEALWLWNAGPEPVRMAGWQISGNGHTAIFPLTSTLTIPPARGLWCTANPSIFRRTFGFAPGCEWGADDDSSVPDLAGRAPRLTNNGGVIQLNSPDGKAADVLVYGDESQIPAGWSGAAAQLYTRGAIGGEGQVWRRKQAVDGAFADSNCSLPSAPRPPILGEIVDGSPQGWGARGAGVNGFADTDSATDWSGDVADLAWGRQVFFPGWSIWRADWRPTVQPIQATGTITLAIGPDGLYAPMFAFLRSARQSLDLSLYTFEHPALAQEIAAAAQRGVAVRLLLEGGPTGGVSDLQRWCVALIAQAGGQVIYLDNSPDAPNGFRPRYRFLHAKYGIADNARSFVGTENPTLDSMPAPVDNRIPPGRRGVYLFNDAAPVSGALAALFAYDWQPGLFWDLRVFDPDRDGPPDGYAPPDPAPVELRPATFRQPVAYSGPFAFALLSAPENAIRADNALVDLLGKAGAGDDIRWMQLYEQKYWGDIYSNPVADPNPWLAAMIDAAGRGARVRLLLDSYFDKPGDDRSNRATVDYLHLVAQSQGVDIQAATGNPAGAGIHAKADALAVGDERWVWVGSINGGEISHKINREVGLLVKAPLLYDRLAAVFDADWAQSRQR